MCLKQRHVGVKEVTMRLMPIFCLAMICASQTHAATPTKGPKGTPVSINIRTASDLADACTLSPTSKSSFARLNFCNGFAQGILQTNGQNSSGAKICIPSPSPKRSETMKEFARWVRADTSRQDELASAAFLRFMAGRFPCT
jgi:Rap1a immunity proteins